MDFRWIKIFGGFIFLSLMISCSPSRETLEKKAVKPMNVGKIVRKINRNTPDYTTFEAKRVFASMDVNGTRNSFRSQVSIKDGEYIIVSLTKMSVPLGKAYISEDSISIVNYHERTYTAGLPEDMQRMTGIDIDFKVLEALFTADLSQLFDTEEFDKSISSTVENGLYRIDSRFKRKIDKALEKGRKRRLSRYMRKMDDAAFIDYTIWVNPNDFTINRILFNDIKYNRTITINYDDYIRIDRKQYPQEFKLAYKSEQQVMDIKLKMSRFEIDKEDDFDFKVPSRYNVINMSE